MGAACARTSVDQNVAAKKYNNILVRMVVLDWIIIQSGYRFLAVITLVPAMTPRKAIERGQASPHHTKILNGMQSKNRTARFKGTADRIL